MDIEVRNYVDTDAGIYYFKNILNNKYYIGQAVNIRKRLGQHISSVLHDRYDAPLYRAIHKYGFRNFEFGILKRLDKDTPKCILDFWEKYYIQYYHSYNTAGYNQTLGGDAGILGLKMNEEQRQRISKNSKVIANDGRNKVFCYKIETKSIVEASSLPALGIMFDTKFSTGDLRNLVTKNKYILARDLKTLNNKIKESDDLNLNKIGVIKITKEALQDIISGMRQKDWVLKYNMSKASYSKHKRKLKREDLL